MNKDARARYSMQWLAFAFSIFAALFSSLAAQAATPDENDCQCAMSWRTYSRPTTQQVKLLFLAAKNADEEQFLRLIKTIPDVSEYAVNGQPLLAALLQPPPPPDQWRYKQEIKQNILRLHQASLAAKTRMLALALEHGASARDTSEDSRIPPLHLAVVFGTPEMVRLLLKHGADVNQPDMMNKTPIEFALDHGREMYDFPELVDAQQRTEMLLDLLAAGAQRPYLRIDNAELPEGETKLERPAADYILWDALAELTVGEKIMEAMSRTGTMPAFDYENAALSPLGYAARAGNLGGLRWLKAHAPRRLGPEKKKGKGGKKTDLWVSAAVWALYPTQGKEVAPKQVDDILAELIAPDMQWDQYNELHDNSENLQINRLVEVSGNTLLNHLVLTGHEDWVRRVVGLGAPVNGVASGDNYDAPPLSQAVGSVDVTPSMIKLLLSLGADPLVGKDIDRSPLYSAIRLAVHDKDRDHGILAAMLERLTPAQKAAVGRNKPSPFLYAIPNPYSGVAGDGSIMRMLLDHGISVVGVGSEEIENALGAEPSSVLDLLDHGVTIRESRASKRSASEKPHPPLLNAALQWKRSPELMSRMISAGADPNYRGSTGINAVEWAISTGDHAALDLMLAHGGRIETAARKNRVDTTTSLDMAVLSGDMRMAQRISDLWKVDMSYACIPEAELLKKIILGATDSYWEYLTNNGLAKTNRSRSCSRSVVAARLVDLLLDGPDTYLVGWLGQRVRSRLGHFWRIETDSGRLEPGRVKILLQTAHAAHREDIVDLLKSMGVKDDAPVKTGSLPPVGDPTPEERVLQDKLVGHYYLKDVHEVGSEIILRPDGRFEYMLSYGAEDEFAKGTWAVRKGRLIFRTPPRSESRTASFRSIPATDTRVDRPTGVSVRVVYNNKAVETISVSVIGCEAPKLTGGETGDKGWTGELPGAICQIVLHHPRINEGRGFVHAVPKNDPMRDFTFEYQPPKEQAGVEMNGEMSIKDGALVLERSERSFRYERD